MSWRPQRDLNPCYRLERAVSWARLDDGDVRGAYPSMRRRAPDRLVRNLLRRSQSLCEHCTIEVPDGAHGARRSGLADEAERRRAAVERIERDRLPPAHF